MKNIRENTLKKPLNILAKPQVFVNLPLNDKYLFLNGSTINNIILYIRAAGRLSHWDQYLSLSTAFRLFFCPTSRNFFTSNDNDK
jgi:hypothetical protein